MSLDSIVEAPPLLIPTLDVAFPSAELVHVAASLVPGHRVPDRDGALVEGPHAFLSIGPGLLQVHRRDWAKAERAAERAVVDARIRERFAYLDMDAARLAEVEDRALMEAVKVCGAGSREVLFRALRVDALRGWAEGAEKREGLDGIPSRVIRSWSRKSRANMRRVLSQLDYAPLMDQGDVRAMLTLTYPGDWQTVAPTSAACAQHVRVLQLRFRRAWGRPLIGLWKREFQRRGAPHYHVLMCPPKGLVNGLNFREWVSRTWADIVGAESCGRDRSECFGECERHRHEVAGTGVDVTEGLRMRDPRRVADYFAKHGVFSAKDYQNEAPDEWDGSVGRFWGVWGLDKAVATVEVTPDRALAAARTLRRLSRARGAFVKVPCWERRLNRATGEVRWVVKSKRKRVVHVRGSAGFLIVNDGPSLAAQLARYLDQLDP